MMDKIRNDHSLGLDSLYKTNIKHEETSFRIVAPFIEHALNPPKKPKKAADDIYDRSAATRKEPKSGARTNTNMRVLDSAGSNEMQNDPSIMVSAHFQSVSGTGSQNEV